jgi:hypothetical protein
MDCALKLVPLSIAKVSGPGVIFLAWGCALEAVAGGLGTTFFG